MPGCSRISRSARSIQQGLLPMEAPRFRDSTSPVGTGPPTRPAADYFDWQELDGGRLAFTLADVTGHGVGPALVTAACRAYNRASLPAHPDLGSAFRRINRLLSGDLPPGTLVQAVVGILDPKTNRIELLSAGHGPLLLYTRRDDRVENFNAHGLPFGVFPDADYGPPQRIDLESGDMLVLITDGFIEWNKPDGGGVRPRPVDRHPERGPGTFPPVTSFGAYRTELSGSPAARRRTTTSLRSS